MYAARRTAWRVLLTAALVSLTLGCRTNRPSSGPADDPRDIRERDQWEINSDDTRRTPEDVQKQRAANEAAFKAGTPGAKR